MESAEIRSVEVEGEATDLARINPGYSVSLRLTQNAADQIKTRLSGIVTPRLVIACGDEARDIQVLSHRVLKQLHLADVGSAEDARSVARAFTNEVRENTGDLPIDTSSVGKVRLGDALRDVVEKLDTCSLALSATPSLTHFATVPLVRVDCGQALQLQIRLDAAAEIADISIAEGKAQTKEGIRIGTPTTDLNRRLGSLEVNVFNDLVFLTSANNNGIAYGIGPEDSARYLVDNQLVSAERLPAGKVTTIWLIGDFKFPNNLGRPGAATGGR